jgi:hypothetical protein
MSDFELYFILGKGHILDIRGYDHILFVIALCVNYQTNDWKKILVLVSAFTVGHSFTLALAVFQIININSGIIEFLIPVTILITSVVNIANAPTDGSYKGNRLNYFFAFFFGLIHGLGFSNYLKSLLGKSKSVVTELFAFNIGIEAGQLVIVLLFIGFGFLLNKYFSIKRRDWIMVISAAVAGISIMLMIETKFW